METYLRESRVVLSLNIWREEERKEEKRTKYSSQEVKGTQEGGPRPWTAEFRVEGGVCQSHSLTSRNRGMLGEPGGLVHSDMLNRHSLV